MTRRHSSDNVVIALALGLGLLALATPLAIRFMMPIESASAAASEKLRPRERVVQPKEPDLSGQRLAFPGGCGVNDFKDGRRIEAQIRRKLQIQLFSGVEVAVTRDCVALLSGVVRSEAEHKRAIKAASHPWTRIDARGLTVYSQPSR